MGLIWSSAPMGHARAIGWDHKQGIVPPSQQSWKWKSTSDQSKDLPGLPCRKTSNYKAGMPPVSSPEGKVLAPASGGKRSSLLDCWDVLSPFCSKRDGLQGHSADETYPAASGQTLSAGKPAHACCRWLSLWVKPPSFSNTKDGAPPKCHALGHSPANSAFLALSTSYTST